jgi:dTMP kinase
MFITFEGVEGCGKSTQIDMLARHIKAEGFEVVVTREPGGTPIGEAIRAILLDPDHHAMSPMTEVLLYAAARAQHVDQLIYPALQRGSIVISDRFADSTTAYQGAARQLGVDLITQVHSMATRRVWPDLTIVLDLDPRIGMQRVVQQRALDRLEHEPMAFHDAVWQSFVALAKHEPERMRVVDVSGPVEEVALIVREIVDQALAAE